MLAHPNSAPAEIIDMIAESFGDPTWPKRVKTVESRCKLRLARHRRGLRLGVYER